MQNHPHFKIQTLGASSRSSNKKYSEAANWKLPTPIPLCLSSFIVVECTPENFSSCQVIFSGLDSDVAGDIEIKFLLNGFKVFSNAKNHRMRNLVPLIVPLVNHLHFDLVKAQQLHYKTTGFIICNANCSTTGLVVPLKALEKFNIDKVMVTTLQAISGAGIST